MPRSVWIAIAVALAMRLAVMAFVYPERLDPARNYWHYAGETGRIARSLALGKGFGSPLFADTGPSAWLGPIFPGLLAGIFKAFGIYSKTSLLTILWLDCMFSALTCVPVYMVARACFSQQTAVRSAFAWAFFPYSIFFAADFVWATTLSTLLLATLFWIALHLRDSGKTRDWASFGLLYGLAALNDPVVLAVLPVLFLWPCYQLRRKGSSWLRPLAVAVAALVVTLTPWCLRNYVTFHKFIPIRGGIGLEFYCGNNADSWHWDPPGYHPSDNATEWQEYQHLGESRFMDRKQAQGFAFIGSHKGLYAVQTLRRVVYIWTGYWSFDKRYLKEEPMDPYNVIFCTGLTILAFLGLRRLFDKDAALARLFAATFLLFPVVYYLTHTEDYYRRPIDPLVVMLAVYAFSKDPNTGGLRVFKRERLPDAITVQ